MPYIVRASEVRLSSLVSPLASLAVSIACIDGQHTRPELLLKPARINLEGSLSNDEQLEGHAEHREVFEVVYFANQTDSRSRARRLETRPLESLANDNA